MPTVWVTGRVVRRHRHGWTAKLLQRSLSTVTLFLRLEDVKSMRADPGSYDTLFLVDAKVAEKYQLDTRI